MHGLRCKTTLHHMKPCSSACCIMYQTAQNMDASQLGLHIVYQRLQCWRTHNESMQQAASKTAAFIGSAKLHASHM